MKKIYRNIAILTIPIIIVILLIPTNPRLKYQGLKDDCFNHGIWIYDRLNSNTKPVDIAFIGSSHTINGIDDELISTELEKFNITAVNFGYCRLGRNLNFTLLKEIIKNKNPKYIFIEVREDENRYGHPIFPYVVESKDVLFAKPFFNRDWFSDIYKHMSYKVELSQDMIFNKTKDYPIQDQDFGFASSPDTITAFLNSEEELSKTPPDSNQNNQLRNFYMEYSRSYLKMIHELCKSNDIKLFFIYLPVYNTDFEIPLEYPFYSTLADVIIPPKVIFKTYYNWHDKDHLNQTGAKILSLWLANEIENEIIAKK